MEFNPVPLTARSPAVKGVYTAFGQSGKFYKGKAEDPEFRKVKRYATARSEAIPVGVD